MNEIELIKQVLDDLEGIKNGNDIDAITSHYQEQLIDKGICPVCGEELESIEVEYNTFMMRCECCGFRK